MLLERKTMNTVLAIVLLAIVVAALLWLNHHTQLVSIKVAVLWAIGALMLVVAVIVIANSIPTITWTSIPRIDIPDCSFGCE